MFVEHKCNFPGCKKVIVLDGNMKNHRDICSAKDAGSIQYPGLPGHIKTGCMASPSYKSRYCSNHDVRSCSTSNATDCAGGDGIVEVLLAVKETRGSKYYQVLKLKDQIPEDYMLLRPYYYDRSNFSSLLACSSWLVLILAALGD